MQHTWTGQLKNGLKRRSFGSVLMVFVFGVVVVLTGCSDSKDAKGNSGADMGEKSDSAVVENRDMGAGTGSAREDEDEDLVDSIAVAPGIGEENTTYVAPLADAYNRIDPTRDGWESEAFSAAATDQLKKLAKALAYPAKVSSGDLPEVISPAATLNVLPESADLFFEDSQFQVFRGSPGNVNPALGKSVSESLAALLQPIMESEKIQTGVKLYRIEPRSEGVMTRVIFNATGRSGENRIQLNTEYACMWSPDIAKPLVESMELIKYERTVRKGGGGSPLLSDATYSVLGDEPVYQSQLMQSTDHWRSRIPRILGLDVVANHGLALGDVNGDGLDDLYLCQQGGIPNRLFIQQPDGTLKDFTSESGTGWLNYCSSALIIDLDQDGDRDLVIGQDFNLVFMSNNGNGIFTEKFLKPTHAQTFSLSAADFDHDGDLDIFACGYNPSADRVRTGALGGPIPYHDAQNGGRNILLENQGNASWEFVDATTESGLDHNNNRFSFAAAWIDFDNDRDLDLYVANDYGRNNLYRNDAGRFTDVADILGVEDMSAGMSTSWSDFNRDGNLDLYVSNMFSAAGNRITFQRQFKPGISDDLKSVYQRHARGNSLFQGTEGGAGFTDVSEEMGVSMGRWAWGSRFADLNNDGWDDIVVANGFITTEDTGDL